MTYFIDRNGQQWGPYTLDQLRGYASGGSILPTDQARNAETGETTVVSRILAEHTTPIVPPDLRYPRPDHAPVVPLPPNLHWAVVLLLSFFVSPFGLGWMIYQMVWVRNLDRQSRALLYFLVGIGAFVGFALIGAFSLAFTANAANRTLLWPGILLMVFGWLGGMVLHLLAIFDLRRSMVAYYNTVEPIGLRLSGVMTFFFNVYYFQHHMSRIVTWKQTGWLSPQS